MNPLVSLIVPVLNVEPYLDECFRSIVAQDYDNFEVIIVLGKSEDNSEAICHEWTRSDSRFRIEPQLKHSLGYARNVGIKAAKGDYIAFCDSDDAIKTDFLSALIEIAIRDNADIVESQFTFCSEALEPISDYTMLTWGEKLGHDFLEIASSPTAWKYLVKTSVFRDNNIYYPEVKFGEDIGMYSLLFSCCRRISYVNRPLYLYRKSPKSLSNNPAGKASRYESFFEILDFMYENFNRLELFEDNWKKLIFQIENHISDNLCSNIDDPELMTQTRTGFSVSLKVHFPASKTIFDLNVFCWGGRLVASIADRINTINQLPSNAISNRYLFELLDDNFTVSVGAADTVLFDLSCEAQFLSTFQGDITMYIRNWKLGCEKFFSLLKESSSPHKIYAFENYCTPQEEYVNASFINEVLKMLYADIKANHPEVYFIPKAPYETLAVPDINCICLFKSLMDLIHTQEDPK